MCDYDFGSVDTVKTCKRAIAAVKRGDRPPEELMRKILDWLGASERKAAEIQERLAYQTSRYENPFCPKPTDLVAAELKRLASQIEDLRSEIALK